MGLKYFSEFLDTPPINRYPNIGQFLYLQVLFFQLNDLFTHFPKFIHFPLVGIAYHFFDSGLINPENLSMTCSEADGTLHSLNQVIEQVFLEREIVIVVVSKFDINRLQVSTCYFGYVVKLIELGDLLVHFHLICQDLCEVVEVLLTQQVDGFVMNVAFPAQLQLLAVAENEERLLEDIADYLQDGNVLLEGSVHY